MPAVPWRNQCLTKATGCTSPLYVHTIPQNKTRVKHLLKSPYDLHRSEEEVVVSESDTNDILLNSCHNMTLYSVS